MFSVQEYRLMVESFYRRISSVPADLTDRKPRPDAWSLREIIGHLIDSAANNHQRFVRLQEGDLDGFPGYDGERWIEIEKYNLSDWKELCDLWHCYNRHLLHIIGHMDGDSLRRVWKTGSEAPTLEWLVRDYYRHLASHVEHFETRHTEVMEQTATTATQSPASNHSVTH